MQILFILFIFVSVTATLFQVPNEPIVFTVSAVQNINCLHIYKYRKINCKRDELRMQLLHSLGIILQKFSMEKIQNGYYVYQ